MKITALIAVMYVLVSASCGGAGEQNKKAGGNQVMAPPQVPMNLTPVKARQKKAVKPANINFFANENLIIPPFNLDARNIAPELLVENGKEQRDPFRNLYDDILNDSKTDTSTQNISDMDPGTAVLLEQYNLSQLRLTGIIWSAGREKALFQSPDGQPTTVGKEDRLSKIKAIVKEITHDRVILEIPGKKDETGKMMEFSLVRASGPYQIQYEKLRPDQRGIRVRTGRRNKK